MEAWVTGEGGLLRLYATYCALDEHLHSQNPDLWVCSDWPARRIAISDSDAVRQFAAETPSPDSFPRMAAVERGPGSSPPSSGTRDRRACASACITISRWLPTAADPTSWAHRKSLCRRLPGGFATGRFLADGADLVVPSARFETAPQKTVIVSVHGVDPKLVAAAAALMRIDHVMRQVPALLDSGGGKRRAACRRRIRPRARARPGPGFWLSKACANSAVIVGEDLGTV